MLPLWGLCHLFCKLFLLFNPRFKFLGISTIIDFYGHENMIMISLPCTFIEFFQCFCVFLIGLSSYLYMIFHSSIKILLYISNIFHGVTQFFERLFQTRSVEIHTTCGYPRVYKTPCGFSISSGPFLTLFTSGTSMSSRSSDYF